MDDAVFHQSVGELHVAESGEVGFAETRVEDDRESVGTHMVVLLKVDNAGVHYWY